MREVGYSSLMDEVMRDGFVVPYTDVSVRMANEAFSHSDLDFPIVQRTSLGGRCVLIVEGERAIVGPIIAFAQDAINGGKR